MSSTGPARWQRLGAELRLRTRILDVLGVRFRHPVRGRENDFVVLQSPDWVNVVAVTPDDRIVLVRQFRFGIDAFSLELPGGIIEEGEPPLEAGLRELREETGHAGPGGVLLGSVHPNPAIQSNRCHFVLVEGAAAAHASDWDPDEEMEVEVLPVAEVFRRALAGGITHGLTLNALMLYAARRGRAEGGV